jgi:hypothetical protein
VAQRIAAREHRQVLHDDRVGQRVHDLQRRDAALDQVDDVGLGEHAAFGGDVVQLRVVEADLHDLFIGEADLDHALVDGGAGARRALVVHRGDGGLAAGLLVLLEDDDLGVLTAQLADRADVGVQGLDRQGDRVDLLHELRPDVGADRGAARAGDEGADLVVTQVRERRSDPFEKSQDELGLLRLMPEVVAPEDLLGHGVDDHRLDRGRADVDSDRDRFGAWIHGRSFCAHAGSL